jgi:hypothetical protein
MNVDKTTILLEPGEESHVKHKIPGGLQSAGGKEQRHLGS